MGTIPRDNNPPTDHNPTPPKHSHPQPLLAVTGCKKTKESPLNDVQDSSVAAFVWAGRTP